MPHLYRTISLSQGQQAIVDEEDYGRISNYSWKAQWAPNSKCFYAVRAILLPGKKRSKVYMHRTILNLRYGDRRQVDHKNHDTLDNRRENLRVADYSQNGHNRFKQKNNTSGYKGVYFNKKDKKWIGQITIFGKTRNVAYCNTAIEAHVKRSEYILLLNNEFILS